MIVLKDSLKERLNYLSSSIILARGSEFKLSIAEKSDLSDLNDLYNLAFNRSELFGINTEEEFEEFKKNKLEEEIEDETHLWIISKSLSGEIATSTLFEKIEDYVVLDDYTQTHPDFRGLGLMQKVFGKVLTLIKKLNYVIEGESVLTEFSKSLRYAWLKENNAICTGIKPNVTDTIYGIFSNLITPIYPNNVLSGKAIIIPQLKDLFGIVAEQISLENPVIIDLSISNNKREIMKNYSEIIIDGTDPIQQSVFYEKGFRPVWYDPLRNKFGMAKFSEKFNLDFLKQEDIKSADKLLNYIKNLN